MYGIIPFNFIQRGTMTTYHLSVYKPTLGISGFPGHPPRSFKLENESEFTHVKKMCENTTNMAGFLKQTFLPIRTDRMADVFLPTLMNLVLKTADYAEDAFLILGGMAFDIFTLPSRLAFFLPRATWNMIKDTEEHPLIEYLKNKGVHPTWKVKGAAPQEIDMRVTVHLCSRQLENSDIVDSGTQYTMSLSNREVAFPTYKSIPYYRRINSSGENTRTLRSMATNFFKFNGW